MDDEVVVDREMLRAINADSRISILKALKTRQKTQSELASELRVSAPTVLEHMDQLEKARLIELVPEYADKKWKYYRLTRTGRGIVEGKRMNVILLLSASSAVIGGALIALYVLMPALLGSLTGQSHTNFVPSNETPTSGGCGPGVQCLSSALSSLESSSRTLLGAAAMVFLLLAFLLAAIHVLSGLFRKKE